MQENLPIISRCLTFHKLLRITLKNGVAELSRFWLAPAPCFLQTFGSALSNFFPLTNGTNGYVPNHDSICNM